MRALVYEGPRIMQMRDVPLPALKPAEVLINVQRVGICGSELGGYLGKNSLRKPPLIMGHEFSGVIAQVGTGVSGITVGDRVTANPLVTCGSCRYCRNGQSQLCADRQLLGAHRPGAFAEYVAVPAENVFRLAEQVTYEAGAFTESFACAVHVCRLLALAPTQQLLIFGAGPIGLCVLQAAQVYGLVNIVVVDLNRARLNIAQELGAQVATSVNELPQGVRFDAVVDAVGADVTRYNSTTVVRPGGKVVFTGLHSTESELPVNDIIRQEISLQGAFAYSPEDFTTALSWLEHGRVDLLPWAVNAPLCEGGSCFEKLVADPGKIAKIILTV